MRSEWIPIVLSPFTHAHWVLTRPACMCMHICGGKVTTFEHVTASLAATLAFIGDLGKSVSIQCAIFETFCTVLNPTWASKDAPQRFCNVR